ncbi:MAG TPA: lysoplasmalogenase [bacterium]|nr:lysoplasmalogenase [bacterium]
MIVSIGKPLLSTGFLLFAWKMGAWETAYGRLIFAALGLSWAGDLLLIPKSSKWFLAGLASFFFAHLLFCAAFAVRGVSFALYDFRVGLPVLATGLAGRWILPHVERKTTLMKIPVIAYMAAITVMTILALGAAKNSGNPWIGVGAVLFYVSDLFVARDRFVSAGWINRAWGLPLYYAAQFVLASTVSR